MHAFKDRDGRDWMLDITVLTVERVKASCKVDLPGLMADRMAALDALFADDLKMVEVVYECSRDRAGKLEDLKAAWDGETADRATEAFLEELIGFFRDPARREALRRAIQALKELGARVMAKGAASLTPEAMDAAADQVFEFLKKRSANGSSASSGNTPATSDSIPDPSLSATSM